MCEPGGADYRCNSPTCQGRSTPQVQAERRNNRNYRRDLANTVAARGDFALAKQVMKARFTAMPELTQAAGLDPDEVSSAMMPGRIKRHQVSNTDKKLVKELSRATSERRVLDPDQPDDLIMSVRNQPLDINGFDAEDFEYTKRSFSDAIRLNEGLISEYEVRGQFNAATSLKQRNRQMFEDIDRLELAQKAKGATLDREWTDDDQLARDWEAVADKTMGVRESRAVYMATSDDVCQVTEEINDEIVSPVTLDTADGPVAVSLYGGESGRGEPTSIGADMMYALTGRADAYGEGGPEEIVNDPRRQIEITSGDTQYVVRSGEITEYALDADGNRIDTGTPVDPDSAKAERLRGQVIDARNEQAERIRSAVDDSGISRERMSQLHPRSIASEAARAETMRTLLSDSTNTFPGYSGVTVDDPDDTYAAHRAHAEQVNSMDDAQVADQFTGTVNDAGTVFRIEKGTVYGVRGLERGTEGVALAPSSPQARGARKFAVAAERARAEKIADAEQHNDQARRFLFDQVSGSYDSGQRVSVDGKDYLIKGTTITGPTGRLIKPDATLGMKVLAAAGGQDASTTKGTTKPKVKKGKSPVDSLAPSPIGLPDSDAGKANLASLSGYDPHPAKLDQYATFIESATDEAIVSTFDGSVRDPGSGKDFQVRAGKVYEDGSETPLAEDSDQYRQARAVMIESERARARTIRQNQSDLAEMNTSQYQDQLTGSTHKVVTVNGRRYVIDEGTITGPTGRRVNPDGQLGRRVLAAAGLSDVQDTVPNTWREYVEESGSGDRHTTDPKDLPGGEEVETSGDNAEQSAAMSPDEIGTAMGRDPVSTPMLDDHLDDLEPEELAQNPEYQKTLGQVRSDHDRDTELAGHLYRVAGQMGKNETVAVDGENYTRDQLTEHADQLRHNAEKALGTWEAWADDGSVNKGVRLAMENTPEALVKGVPGLDSGRQSADGLLNQTQRIIDAAQSPGAKIGRVNEDLLNARTPEEFVRKSTAARKGLLDTAEYAQLLDTAAEDLDGVGDPRADKMREAAEKIARLSMVNAGETDYRDKERGITSYTEGFVSHAQDISQSLNDMSDEDELGIAETALGAGNTRVADHVRRTRNDDMAERLDTADRYGGDDIPAPRPVVTLAGDSELLREYGRGDNEDEKRDRYGGGHKPGDPLFADTYMAGVFADMNRDERELATRDMWLVMESHFSDDEEQLVREYEQDPDLEPEVRERYARNVRVRAQSLREHFIEVERQAVEDPTKAAELAHLAYHDQWEGWDPNGQPNRIAAPEGVDPLF